MAALSSFYPISPHTLSDLSSHTRNLVSDPRSSILFEAASRLNNPQAGSRATLLGRIHRVEDDRLYRRFLAHHPGATLYAGFGDFHMYRMSVERAHVIGGFARAEWMDADDVIPKDVATTELTDGEAAFLERFNRDYQQAIHLLAAQVLRRPGSNWTIVGIDIDGCDFCRKQTLARLDFDNTVGNPTEFERTIQQLIKAVETNDRPSEG